jgi:pyruvate/2-oxoglutarate dehydrogenase complex dihydrolipoamide acyltransferase (E2) component
MNKNNKFGRIRELKVNGIIGNFNSNSNSNKISAGQHRGIGSRMLEIAQEMATRYSMTHVTVTSAVGVRDYYRKKHNFQLDESSNLMYKELVSSNSNKEIKQNMQIKLIRITDTKFEVIPNTTNWLKIIILIILSLINILSLILIYKYFL